MAERLKSLTRSQMESYCASSNLADYDTFRSPGLNTSNHQTVRNNGEDVNPWEREKSEKEKSNRTVTETMTNTDAIRDSEMQSWRSAEGVSIEITWVPPSQIWNLFTLILFRSTLLNTSNSQKVLIYDFYVIHPETKNSHSSSTNIDRRIKVKTLSW